ncbi:MAG: hypothetical protein JXR37_07090 [Kiritimatiellae bacterium]|nr:hypothetical protein [Kiritimatiellia bacterium]
MTEVDNTKTQPGFVMACWVKNQGDRSISYLVLEVSVKTTDSKNITAEVRFNGPFPPGQATRAAATIPDVAGLLALSDRVPIVEAGF